MQSDLRTRGFEVDGIYYCPHHPDFGEVRDCFCRKPKPGMLLTAARDMRIDLTRSWMLGDKMSDIYAGIAAGVKAALVSSLDAEVLDGTVDGISRFGNVLQAARFIVSRQVGELV